jgi:hypothetical protein
MAVVKDGDGYRVKKKGGGMGKRLFTTKAAAEAAQARGKALLRSGGGGGGTTGNPGNPENSSKKNFTIGNIMDIGAFAAPAIYRGSRVWEGTESVQDAGYNIAAAYTGYHPGLKNFSANRLVVGYGAAVNRMIEKKIFKALRIRGPRTRLETVGDALDHLTYFGKTFVEVWENKDNPSIAVNEAMKTQYGMDYTQPAVGLAPWQPLDMLTEKIAPYVAQKYVRKFLRASGMKLPSMKLLG